MRSAEAEPEAEADPALLYNTYGYGLPYTTGVHAYSAYPYAYGHRAYSAYPYTYGTYAYGKRSAEAEPKAEADPALLYSTGLVNPVTYTHAVPAVAAHTYAAVPAVQQVAAPVVNTVYSHVAQPVYSHVAQPLVYANPLVKVADHAVAATAAGFTHSSNVGICTNNLGIQVPC